MGMPGVNISIIAGTHQQGLRMFINGHEVASSSHHATTSSSNMFVIPASKTGTRDDCILSRVSSHRASFHCDEVTLEFINSDLFFNARFTLNDHQLLHAGAKHTVQRHAHSHAEHHHSLGVHSAHDEPYPHYPLHGLVGQTWKNIEYMDGHVIEGTHADYVTGELFNPDFHFSQYRTETAY